MGFAMFNPSYELSRPPTKPAPAPSIKPGRRPWRCINRDNGCTLNRLPSIHIHSGKVARPFNGASCNPTRAVRVIPIIEHDQYSACPANNRRIDGLRNSNIRRLSRNTGVDVRARCGSRQGCVPAHVKLGRCPAWLLDGWGGAPVHHHNSGSGPAGECRRSHCRRCTRTSRSAHPARAGADHGHSIRNWGVAQAL